MSGSPELYACLLVREFPAQAMLRLRPELHTRPVAVMEGEPPLQSVCSMNRWARNLGVVEGMTRVELDSLPSVAILSRSRSEEATAQAALLECAGGFSPRVEDLGHDPVFLCVLDLAGTEKLFGPPERLGRALLQSIQALGMTASVAVSHNFHAAICLARGMAARKPVTVVPQDMLRDALASLPLAVLDLSAEEAETFFLWGISTLGRLALLPEKEWIARMGQKAHRLRQLAQGKLPHVFQPVESPFLLEEHLELDAPVEDLDSLLFLISVLLEPLTVRAIARALAPASVTLTLRLEGDTLHTRTVRPALPSTDRQLWLKLLRLDLQTHPPSAAIVSLTLQAEPGSTRKVQLGLFSPQLPEPLRLDLTLARIQALVGENCVGRAVLNDTHRPEGFHMEPFVLPSGAPPDPRPKPPHTAARQLRPAESVPVILEDHRPAAFVFHERRFTVERAYGPWLSSGEWWNPTLWAWEHWDLIARSDDGAPLKCCMARDPIHGSWQWQIVALYD